MPVQTLPFHSLIPIDRKSATPIFQQLTNGVMQLIKAGTLQPGVPLPSSRDMATLMKLNRTTIVAAYDELRIQGWIEAIARKGFAVSGKLPVLHPKSFHANQHSPIKEPPKPSFYKIISPEAPVQMQRKVYDLVVGDGYPDARIAPLQLLINKYRALQNRHYKHMSVINELPAGSALLRNELAAFLSQTRGLNISADNTLLIRGPLVQVQQGELGYQTFKRSRQRPFKCLITICQQAWSKSF